MNKVISQKHGRFSLSIMMLSLSIFGTYSVNAQVINEQEACQRAEAFIETHGLSDRGPKWAKEAQDKRLEMVYLQANKQSGDPLYYVFQQPHSKGFVIASADERVVPIFCYSTEGTFNMDSIPCCLKAILEGFEQKIAFARERNFPKYVSPLNEDNDYPSISPLTETEWHQYSPFNLYCPIDKETGKRSVVGCVASAQAQLLYYYKWPEKGVGSYSYQWRDTTLYANFGETQYKYDSMVSRYYDRSIENEEVADALATINYHCGVSVNMNYSSGASASNFSRGAMENFFRFKQVLYKEGKKTEDLDAVYEELSHQRPLLATTTDHAFILDGYEKGGYVHFNLGSNFVNCYVSWYDKSGWYDGKEEDLQDRIGWWDLRRCYGFIPDKDIKEIEKDGIKYLVYDEKALVAGGNISGELNIPPTIVDEGNKELKVVRIFDNAFEGNLDITSVTIPHSVAYIGDNAFSDCKNLFSATISEGVRFIGIGAFDKTGLKSITIPNSVLSIGISSFGRCPNLTDVSLSESLETIPSNAFWFDRNLTSITIPNSVKHIESQAFSACEKLCSVVMPDSLLSIGINVFMGCNKLSSLKLPQSIISIDVMAFDGAGFRDLYCERTDPSGYNCSEQAFGRSFNYPGSFDFSKCTLHVPIGCKEAYASLSPWSNFTNIVEDVLGIDDVEEDKVTSEKYYSIDGRAMDGTPTNKEIFVRNGKKVIMK